MTDAFTQVSFASSQGRTDLEDLTERLVRLRERLEREGRKVAIEKIDRAIAESQKPEQPSN